MYSVLAQHYDMFMADSGNERRFSFVLDALKACKSGRNISADSNFGNLNSGFSGTLDGADLACGTGAMTIALAKSGHNIFGVDISPEMLGEAAKNAQKAGLKLQFICQDIGKFTPIKPLDFITCVCDGVNYLKDPQKLFVSAAKALKTGGLFIFDISTEYKIREILAGNTFSETLCGVTYIWKNALFGNKLSMELTFFEPEKDGRFIRKNEVQTQYIHSLSHLQQLLDPHFSVKITNENGRKLSEKSTRAFFVAQKK